MYKFEIWLGAALAVYLLAVGFGGTLVVAINFPVEENGTITFPYEDEQGNSLFLPFGKLGSPNQGLVLIALFAGIAGSFLHSAQSLSSYLGNQSFKASWTTWYLLRPWVGSILGLSIYIVFRAGLVGGASAVNTYGVVALGVLGGWFSKTTTDKLEEVFHTLFKTEQDKKRKDKLASSRAASDERADPAEDERLI